MKIGCDEKSRKRATLWAVINAIITASLLAEGVFLKVEHAEWPIPLIFVAVIFLLVISVVLAACSYGNG